MADFNKIGLLVICEGRILMCRKDHFTSKLILPGGRIEPGESAQQCLVRELREELGEVTPAEVEFVGSYADIAASDDPSIIKTLEIQLYRGRLVGTPVPSAEIVELVWFGPDSDKEELSPIMVNKILPDLRHRGLINW